MQTREEDIRLRAYELWEQAGRTGSSEQHWLQAERELEFLQNTAEALNEPPRQADASMPGDADEVQGPSQEPAALAETVRGQVSRMRTSLLEFMATAPRGWPWRLSHSRLPG
jgi:hypothetical protein